MDNQSPTTGVSDNGGRAGNVSAGLVADVTPSPANPPPTPGPTPQPAPPPFQPPTPENPPPPAPPPPAPLPPAPLPGQVIRSPSSSPLTPAIQPQPPPPNSPAGSDGSPTKPPAPPIRTPSPTAPNLARRQRPRDWIRRARLVLVIIALLVGIAVVFLMRNQFNPSASVTPNDASNRFGTIKVPLDELSKGGFFTIGGARNVSINGQLRVSDSLVLEPMLQPLSPITGQLYYDQTVNQLAYYNGSRFVALSDSTKSVVQSLGGSSGTINIGAGLNVSGGVLSNTGVLSIGGARGDITLGSGLSMNGQQLANTGVLNVVAGTGNLSVTTSGSTVTISTVGIVGVQGGHVVGQLAKFTGTQTVGDSIINDNGTTVTVNGNLSLTGGGQYQLGGVQISSAALSNDADLAKLSGTQTFTGNNTFKNSTDSTTSLQIKDSSGASVVNVDTTNRRLGVGTATPAYALDVTGDINTSGVYRIGGTSICTSSGCTPAAGSTNYIQNGTAVQSSANFAIQSAAAANVGGVIRGASGQTADLLQLQNSAGTNQFNVTASGAVTEAGALTVSAGGATITGNSTITGTLSGLTGLTVASGTVNLPNNSIADTALSTNIAKLNGTQTFTGTNTFKPPNSTAAFQVQNASGTTYLDVDTTNGRVGVGNAAPAYALDVTGDINTSTVLRIGGTTVCTSSGCTSSGSGSFIQNGTTIQTSANFAIQSAAAASVGGLIKGAASQTADLLDLQNSSGTNQFSVSSGGAVTEAGALTVSAGGATITAGGLTVTAGGATVTAGGLTVNAGGAAVTGNSTFKPTSNGITAFQVQNAAGTTYLDVDTTNGRVGIGNAAPAYPLDVTGDINTSTALRIGGTSVCTSSGCTSASGSGNYIQNGTSVQSSANFAIQSGAAASVGGVIRGAASQTADLFRLQTSTPTTVLSVGSSGAFLSQNSANSVTAFQVQNAAGTTYLDVDTTNGRVGVGNAAPAYALDVTGDINSSTALRIGGTSICTSSGCTSASGSANYIQNGTSVQSNANFAIQSAAAASVGGLIRGAASQTADLFDVQTSTPSTVFGIGSAGAISIQPTSDSTTALNLKNSVGNNMFTIDSTNSRVGIALSGNTLPASTLEVGGSVRLSGNGSENFTTPQGSNVATKINIPTYNPGNFAQILAFGLPSSAAASARALSLFDARTVSHQPTVSVFTPDEANLIGFSWDGSNANGLVKSTTNNIYLQANGVNALAALYSSGVGRVGINMTGPAYTLDVSGDTNISSGSVYRIAGTTVCSGTTCTPASGSTNYIQNGTSVQSSANFAIQSGAAASVGGVIRGAASQTADLLQLQTSTPTTVFSVGSSGAVLAQNSANSTTAFRVQNAAGTNVFLVDTTNLAVKIGGGDTNPTGSPTLLVMANKNTSGDPAGIAGAMYFNANTNKLRCYETYWRDCSPSPRTSYSYVNEFFSNNTDGVTSFTTSGTGAVADGNAVVAVTGHPGIVQMGTGTTTTGAVLLGANDFGHSILLGNGDTWRAETVFRLGALSTSTQRYTIRNGFDNSSATDTDATDGCYFKYSDNLNSGKWLGQCTNGGTASTCDTGTAVAASTWYRLTVAVNSGGTSADFQVNGTSACQVTTNIPTGSTHTTSFGSKINKATGTTSATEDLDYITIEGQMGTSR